MTGNPSAWRPASLTGGRLLVAAAWLLACGCAAWAAEALPEDEAPGLGTETALPTISWENASDYLGKEVFLVGKAVRTGRSRTGHVFLNFTEQYRNTATVFISREHVSKFPQAPDKAYRNKTIRVRGFLYEHQGAPNLSVASPAVITVLADDAPLPAVSRPAPATRPAIGEEITIGSYNLLNLFDSADDPYTSDETTPPKPRRQVEAVAKSIRAINADVLGVVEVENRGVLQQFVDRYLPDLGYEVVLFEGNDNRGIDVGLLTRLPVGPVTSHRHLRFNDLNGNRTQFQRDLLQVRLEPPGGTPFLVFVVHFKSKRGEEDGGLEIRLPEARVARAVFDTLLKNHPEERFVVCGDFNDHIDSHPLQALIGDGPGKLIGFIEDLPPDGRVTYNREPFLSMIDFILASPAMARQYVPKSYTILPGSQQTTGSDHNPVLARFRIR